MSEFSSSIAASLAEFIGTETGAGAISETDDLIETGLLDSLLVMSVVSFVENRFGIRTAPAEITPARFRSVSALADWVLERQAKAA